MSLSEEAANINLCVYIKNKHLFRWISMKNGWVQENVMWVNRPLCPQESHVPRLGAGVTVGALARGRSRESREKMKNSPWGLSKSQAWARAHVWATAEPLPQWPLCQGWESQHSPASQGAQHLAHRNAPRDISMHVCEMVHSPCICVNKCSYVRYTHRILV